jgi:hypothetical protein
MQMQESDTDSSKDHTANAATSEEFRAKLKKAWDNIAAKQDQECLDCEGIKAVLEEFGYVQMGIG